ncbi:MAG: endonuclease/exonuclease/phosphatase family protein, partial [Longimicrobiales bacterium]|nr:endonuclease/exonuclease/phosphatase family protein [Longimicrobiales bacterium]
GGLKVLSQNLYLGIDLGTLLTATTAEEVQGAFQQLITTSAFDAANPAAGPRRLRDIAEMILAESPHVAALQEVTRYEFTFADGSEAVLDFREVLQGWLDTYWLMGYTPYRYEWVVNPLVEAPTLELPVMGGVAVDYHDADALLIRSDVATVGAPVLGTFAAVQPFSVFGTVFEYWRGWQAVTIEFGGREIVVVNTHLEVQQFEDVQLAQTAELIEWMDGRDAPVIALGDFNSAANHDAPEDQYSGSYPMLRQAGYADLWLREAHSVGGVTCCQAGDLTNSESQLTARLDLVLVKWGAAGFGGRSRMEVLGEEPSDRIEFTGVSPFLADPFPVTLWPSDHAGVVATMWPAPGRLRD